MKTKTFFTKNKDIKFWLSSDFKDFLKLAGDDLDLNITLPKANTLPKSMNDFEIVEKYHNVQSPNTIASQIATLIAKQPKGEPGTLLTNSDVNIWHYKKDENDRLCYVGVGWDADRGGWDCIARVADSGEWREGSLAFSPATLSSDTDNTQTLGILETLQARLDKIKSWAKNIGLE